MSKVVIRTGTLSAASTLHTRRRRANDNVVDVPIAAGAEVCGDFTPVIFDGVGAPYASVVQASRNPDTPTIVRARRTTPNGGLLVSNANHRGAFDGPRTARTPGWIARLWAALWREWTIMRAASELKGMSDWQLSDIGVQRGHIDFIVRFGRDAQPRQHSS